MGYPSINVNFRSSVKYYVDKDNSPDKNIGARVLGSRVVKNSCENTKIIAKSEYLSKRKKSISSMDVQKKSDILKKKNPHSTAVQVSRSSGGVQRGVSTSDARIHVDEYFTTFSTDNPILGVTVSSFHFPNAIRAISPGTEFIYVFTSGDGECTELDYERAKAKGEKEVIVKRDGWKDNDGNELFFELVEDVSTGNQKLRILYNNPDESGRLGDGDIVYEKNIEK